ncbi:MMPL family transporter [Vibrio sinaloensis]|uniref:MMPL family transporter n=1 Tax=Photobacterium sp. (strain ATCC 43367) TaxID=379097 RepID=UPI00205A5859|nr:MMPL family transporter [Vibrio sinaloensis]UPQ89367.1 MMPL family transporter [Vibrio sinaloensis]
MLNKRNSASNSGRRLALIWLVLVLACAALLVKQWLTSPVSPIETNVLKLLPKNQHNPIAEQAFESVANHFSDQVVFVLSADSEPQRYAAAHQLEQQLRATGLFTKVVGKISAEEQNQWANFYYQHRYLQLTPTQRERLEHSPEQQTQQVIQALYNPFSGVTGNELKNDPFLLFRDFLAELTSLNNQFRLKQDFLTAEYQGQHYVLVTATLASSPYSLSAQQGVAEIKRIEQAVSAKYQAKIYHTGVLFYAEFGSQSAKSEISTIGLFSLLGVVVLIVTVFRSAAPLALALLSITTGLLVTLSLTTLLFGKVHLFSLVFGASLIGVSIDYAFHYLTERLAAGEQWDSQRGLQHIFAAITLGLITSLIGYLGMLIAPFPGLQQLALFSSIGLLGAYITVVVWYPLLARKATPSRPLPGQHLAHRWLALWSSPRVKFALPALCILASLLTLTAMRYDDDIRQLQAMPSSLKQQEQLISDISGLRSSQQMLVVSAANDEQLMQRLESLSPTFEQWQQTGVMGGYQSLSQYLPSLATQAQNYALIDSLYQKQGSKLAQALRLNQVPSLEQPLKLLTLDNYLDQQVAAPVRFLYVGQVGEQVAAVVVLDQIEQLNQVKAFADAHGDISYLNKAEEISSLFAEYRVKVMELLLLAIAVIGALLAKRYGIKHALLVLAPSVIACVAGLAAAVALGSTLNLFNLLALILIIGIGIDYTLFFAEKARSASTLLAISLSAMTTLLSFGLLSLSQTHAIHSFGVTVLSGIFVAWLLSPLAINDPEPQ